MVSNYRTGCSETLQPWQADANAETHTEFPSEMLGTAVSEKALEDTLLP